jgi:hypothetical protein
VCDHEERERERERERKIRKGTNVEADAEMMKKK